MAKNIGLGKGFDSLLPKGVDSGIFAGSVRVSDIHIDAITPNKNQPRKHFSEDTLTELADSISKYGVLQPIIVTQLSENEYQIVAGERRWRASKRAGLETIPAIIRSLEELQSLEVAILENVQRVDLSPLEQAESYLRLHELFSMSFEIIAQRIGKATSTVNNIVRLVRLPENAKNQLAKGAITEGHARTILSLEGNDKKQEELLQYIIKDGWTVRQAEQFVVATKNGLDKKKATQRTNSSTVETNHLEKLLGRKVGIKNMAKGGKLYIGFRDEKDLKELISLLNKISL